MSAQRKQLPEGRWHYQHGPIDIVIDAQGDAAAVNAAHEQAWSRFENILSELVSELPLLRSPVDDLCRLQGPTARRMWQACQPYCGSFITPMAAVAGAVAQELISFYEIAGIRRAWVNNGGDIALHLASEQLLRVGLYADLAQLSPQQVLNGVRVDGYFDVNADMRVRGVATSGWRGRSFSLGIADSVTVLARTAAEADAAATVIANAVNVQDARIRREPACDISDDCDLGDLRVTVDVPVLPPELVKTALDSGLKRANELRLAGLIGSAVMVCQNQLARTLPVETKKSRIATAKTRKYSETGSVFA